MPSASPIIRHRRGKQAEERRLRAGILRLGTLLGWDAPTVVHFAEAVTGCSLSRSGRAELRQVLEAYATLDRGVRAAQARQPGTASRDGETV